MARGESRDLRRMLDSLPHKILLIPRREEDARRLASILVKNEIVDSAGVETGMDTRSPGSREKWVYVKTRSPTEFYSRIAGVLQGHGIPVRHISSQDDNLEALYRYLMWGSSWRGY